MTYARDELQTFDMSAYPPQLEKKVTLIKYFKNFLTRGGKQLLQREHDIDNNNKCDCNNNKYHSDGEKQYAVRRCTHFVEANCTVPSDIGGTHNFVYVKRFLTTEQAIVFRLSNKVIQVCFTDGDDVLLHTISQMITYTNMTGMRQTLPLSALAIHDCKLEENSNNEVDDEEEKANQQEANLGSSKTKMTLRVMQTKALLAQLIKQQTM